MQLSPAYEGRDVKHARGVLEELATAGDAEAQLRLGFAFQVGRFGKRDVPSARIWYERAAAQGMTDAQGELGIFHAYGMSVARNFDTAIELLQKASAKTTEYDVELARLYIHRGEFKRAAELLEKNHVEDMTSLVKHVYARLCLEQAVCASNRAQAQALFDAANTLDAQHKNELAWFLVVFPTADAADGTYAVKMLKPETDKHSAEWSWVGTLAAAYARSGDFPAAVATQKRANEMRQTAHRAHPGDATDSDNDEEMLRAYEQHKPWESPY